MSTLMIIFCSFLFGYFSCLFAGYFVYYCIYKKPFKEDLPEDNKIPKSQKFSDWFKREPKITEEFPEYTGEERNKKPEEPEAMP